MKDKEKQIEEMEFDLTMMVQRDYYGHTLFKETAERLINQGYRKLPEDSVVLSREEYERLKQVEAEKDRLYEIKLDLENQLIEKGWTDYEGAYEIEKRISKETAEKIFVEVLDLEELKVIRDMGWNKVYNSIYNEILELAKQFGVEIKE